MNPRPTAKKLNRTGRNTPARNSTTVCTTAARKQIVDMMRRARSTKGLDFTLSRVARKTGSALAHQSEEFMRSYVFGIAIKAALCPVDLSTVAQLGMQRSQMTVSESSLF